MTLAIWTYASAAMAVALATCRCPSPVGPEAEPAPSALRTASALRATGAHQVEVRYLGSGGLLIKRGRASVMTAPLYSNPFLLKNELCGEPLLPIEKLIDAFVADQGIESDLRDVRVVLSGHAHYDHLMDVPRVAGRYMNRPYLVTSVTGKRTLAKVPFAGEVIALNQPGDNFVDFTRAAAEVPPGCVMPREKGRWWPGRAGPDVGPVRLFAASSEHPPQLAGILFWPGCHSADLAAPPRRVSDYRCGEVMAFLIDLLNEDGSVGFRIYYEDAPIPPTRAQPLVDQLADGHDVDLALLCAGNWSDVKDSHTIVGRLRAREVILHHWEWFFDEKAPKKRKLRALPGPRVADYQELVAKELEALGVPDPRSHVQILKPGVLVTY